jgi:hypothetical protein
MAFMNVRSDELLDDGPYEAELRDVEKKENANGTYLHWKFRIPGTNAEVSGFTSDSASTQAKAFGWAVALNDKIASKDGWEVEDVVGQPCVAVVEAYDDASGRARNKVVKIKPPR